MSTWRVWRSRKAFPNSYEDISADNLFVTQNGGVQFLNVIPDDPSTLCGKPIDGKTCVRVKAHKDTCKAVLGKSRFSAKPRMICVRMLGAVDDLVLL